MTNRIVHFEIETENLERAKKFYTETFGWKMEQMGDDYGNYVTISTGNPKEPTGINGGMYRAKDKKEINAYSCVVSVVNIEKAMVDVRNAGGKVLSEKPDDIPKVELFAKCEDTEGNKFTLIQPSPDMIPMS